MVLTAYVVDAFTDSVFHGNPAAVIPLQTWLPDGLMQSIAAEHNLAETVFCVPEGMAIASAGSLRRQKSIYAATRRSLPRLSSRNLLTQA